MSCKGRVFRGLTGHRLPIQWWKGGVFGVWRKVVKVSRAARGGYRSLRGFLGYRMLMQWWRRAVVGVWRKVEQVGVQKGGIGLRRTNRLESVNAMVYEGVLGV